MGLSRVFWSTEPTWWVLVDHLVAAPGRETCLLALQSVEMLNVVDVFINLFWVSFVELFFEELDCFFNLETCSF